MIDTHTTHSLEDQDNSDNVVIRNRDNNQPSLSFVIPCYNEEAIVEVTISRLLSAFQRVGHHIQIIAVDNGSRDRTGEILKALSDQHPEVVPVRVEKNEGYGNGILSGIPHCTSPWVCIIPADGQVDEEDVVRLYETVSLVPVDVLGKVRRRFRMDGPFRKIISVTYNVFVRMLWPRLGSWDVNGLPKILKREHLVAMELRSKDWFLDPEIMIKAFSMGLRVIELNVFARMRSAGVSHVRMGTCWEFFRNLLVFRFSGRFARWKRQLQFSSHPFTENAEQLVSN